MLFVSESDKYGDKYIEHLLEQYKIYIISAEKISDRRQKANEFFLTLNSALVTLLGFVISRTNKEVIPAVVGLATVAGIIICYLWYRIVRSYKGLNDGNYKVIHAVEARLPLALYDTEWEMLGRGANKSVYWPFTLYRIVGTMDFHCNLFSTSYFNCTASSISKVFVTPFG